MNLSEIRQRVEATTPGPWYVVPELCGPDGQGIYTEDGGHICEVGDAYQRGDNHPQENMAFIAAARTDVPALLDALEALWRFASHYAAVSECGGGEDACIREGASIMCLPCQARAALAKAKVEGWPTEPARTAAGEG